MAVRKAIQVIDLSGPEPDVAEQSSQYPLSGDRSQRPAFVSPRVNQVTRPAAASRPVIPSRDSTGSPEIEIISAQTFTFRTSQDQIARQNREVESNGNTAALPLARGHDSRKPAVPQKQSAYKQTTTAPGPSAKVPVSALSSSDHVKHALPRPQFQNTENNTPAASHRPQPTGPGSTSTARRTGSSRPVFRPSSRPPDHSAQVDGKDASPQSHIPEATRPDAPSLASLLAKVASVNGNSNGYHSTAQADQAENIATKRKALDNGRLLIGHDIHKRPKTQPLQQAIYSQNSQLAKPQSVVPHRNTTSALVSANSAVKMRPVNKTTKGTPSQHQVHQVKRQRLDESDRSRSSSPDLSPPQSRAPRLVDALTSLFRSRSSATASRPPLASSHSVASSTPAVVQSIEDVRTAPMREVIPMLEASDDDDDHKVSIGEMDVHNEVKRNDNDRMAEGVKEEGKGKHGIPAPAFAANEIPARPYTPKGTPFTVEDDVLLLYLKEVLKLQWEQIAKYFPGRKWTGLQSRYSHRFSTSAAQRAAQYRQDPGFSAYAQTVQTQIPANRPRGRHKKEDTEEARPDPVETMPTISTVSTVSTRTRGRPRMSAIDEAPSNAIFNNAITMTETDSGADGPISGRRLTRRTGPVRELSYDSQEATPQNVPPQDELEQLLRQLRQPVSTHSHSRILRDRELGPTYTRAHARMLHAGLRDYAYSTLGPVRYLDDASGDVSTVAWSPNGRHFAAGCVAVTDPESMQYNKTRNLLIADATSGHARELPHHRIPRPLVDEGTNSTEAMRASQSSDLYTTVQSVAFSADGRRMFSVSIDNHLNVYKVSRGHGILKTKLTGRSKHVGPVDLLSVSSSGLVATGCRYSGPGSIQVFSEKAAPDRYTASKPTPDIAMQKYPSALRFGVASAHTRYLLAGFSCEAERIYEEDDVHDTRGEVCLWDTNTGQSIDLGVTNRNVFDLTWNPNPSPGSSVFAVASSAFGKVNKGMHSVVRLYNPVDRGARAEIELECPAWDINDVIYSPHDTNIIAAGSTDGKIFIWDIRQVKNDQGPLRILEHGESLSALPHEKRRWEADTGIRFLSWANDHTRLYSGSSDGVVKCWDPYRSDEEKHVRDVVTFKSAIMSGSFSPDCESLLIGEDLSRLNLLKIGNEDKTIADMDKFTIHEDPRSIPAPASTTDLFSASRDLLETGEIEFRPIGTLPIRQAVQGPDYNGPYRTDAAATALRKQSFHFQETAALLRDERKLEFGSAAGAREPCALDCTYFPAPNIQDEIDNADVAGRFSERIPHALRSGKTPTGLKAQLLGLVAKCEGCGCAARPADEKVVHGVEARALCERCGFKCFRCSGVVELSGRMRVVECVACGLAWRVGVLGYELIRDEDVDKQREVVEVEVEQEIWDLADKDMAGRFSAVIA